jgi:4-diphosphocytidyl-2-C-methyl-D-erythritol kinase
MIVFPNCKINIGLRIYKKRKDGYHDLETIFYPLPFTDVLELIEYRDPLRTPRIPFTTSGLKIEGEAQNNLCVKAYKLLKKDFPKLPLIKMHLHKAIPSGAGLGGGSADAAFTLKLLNDTFELGLSTEKLMVYALELGSDCPFFLINNPCFATGRGETLERCDLNLSGYKIIIVNPGIHINTGKAFSQIMLSVQGISLKEVIRSPIKRWKDELYNDFEKIIFKEYPEVVDVKDQLYVAGAVYASMSGSGSTVFGIFDKESNPLLSFPKDYFIKELLC